MERRKEVMSGRRGSACGHATKGAEKRVEYVECKRCGQKGCQVEENRGQGVISDRQKWYGCQKKKEIGVTYPRRGKAQQSGTWAGVPEGTAKEKDRQREVR